ncbi:MAG: hypothetical protein ACRDHF_00505 [Tepidiformaceae bacterium]
MECAAKARRRDLAAFLAANPGAQSFYNGERGHKDTLIERLRHRYPDLPRECEAQFCGEKRVLDMAHKPGFRRNGAWRTLRVYERHMFWILCPNHHALIDRGVAMPEEFGLA